MNIDKRIEFLELFSEKEILLLLSSQDPTHGFKYPNWLINYRAKRLANKVKVFKENLDEHLERLKDIRELGIIN